MQKTTQIDTHILLRLNRRIRKEQSFKKYHNMLQLISYQINYENLNCTNVTYIKKQTI